MSKKLDEIRRKLQELETRKSPTISDKTVYPHWNIPEGTSATIRFLPDGNEDNTFFWVERQIIKLPFPGIKGQDEKKPIVVQVPCVEMWTGKNTCPILNEVRLWWKDDSLADTARKYWVKRAYYMQGFIKQDPMSESDPPENPIRKLIIGPQIFAIIKAALMDQDMENSPVDYINGTDFIVSKTSKGGYADYGTSKWARKESSITEDMQEAISQFGLVDLSTYLPKRPTKEQEGIMYDMFQDSLDGELYDPEKYSQHFKPYGFDSADVDDDAGEGRQISRQISTSKQVTIPKPVPKAAPVESVDDEPFETDTPKVTESNDAPKASNNSTSGKTPQEILAILRNRNK